MYLYDGRRAYLPVCFSGMEELPSGIVHDRAGNLSEGLFSHPQTLACYPVPRDRRRAFVVQPALLHAGAHALGSFLSGRKTSRDFSLTVLLD